MSSNRIPMLLKKAKLPSAFRQNTLFSGNKTPDKRACVTLRYFPDHYAENQVLFVYIFCKKLCRKSLKQKKLYANIYLIIY